MAGRLESGKTEMEGQKGVFLISAELIRSVSISLTIL